ncbi:MAG: asparagine synthase (glutamine-hydrolyzing) [Rhodospirillales bacterium CG15_BIG_FIL_POST_REV_8_21_14_020_66_15]|nr:MAG: asparagine synthase (glutamine-hydrolyzing) [Rhodospirillales bacterium CG15_BIG_FIL_POST_REV_8_21_14_020_66_15]
MCGIAGIVAKDGRSVDPAELARMSAAIAHRGPDDQGAAAWSPEGGVTHAPHCAALPTDARIGLAHRRLSIIDTGPGGHQPMATPDGRHVLITNGEIYNYLELRRELEAEGTVFASQSDTEVLLIALCRWGVARTLPRLTGMFAFAFLDTVAGTLTLARDPFGIKPLMWALRGGDLAFASEPGALLELTGLSRAVEPQALYDYLRFGLTDRGERTLFREIHHLPPASFAVIDLDRVAAPAPETYWRPRTDVTSGITFDEAARELRRLFMDSVALHLRADVPVGAALSGGIDSSAVVCAMREIEGQDLRLHTFSFTAPGDRHDEAHWADMAGRAARATIHKTTSSGAALSESLDGLIRIQGEPFGSTSIFAQSRVYALVKDAGIKVTLDGQGADEILAGYVPFLAARLAGMLRRGEVMRAARFLCAATDQAGPLGMLARAARFILPTGLQGIARRLVGEDLVPDWMDGRWLAARGVAARAPQQPKGGRVLVDELAESLQSRVLPALLRYQDRNSMSYAVESRVPFLIPELADFVYSLPEECLISGRGETKSVFRAAMRGLVPDAILDRRDKIGFITPQDAWLRESGGWLRTLIDSDAARAVPALDHGVLARRVDALMTDGGPIPQQVWLAANLIRWSEIHQVDFAA